METLAENVDSDAAVPAQGLLGSALHGPVRACGTHLRHADGTWFYSFGTTIYALAHQSQALMDETFDTLAHSPFNKVRLCVFPKHYNYNHNNPQYYAFEDKLLRLMDLGIEADLILFHPYDRWGFANMLRT